MTEQSFGGVVSDHPVVVVAAALTGAAILAGVLALSGAFADSEEAPIRVKNGSLDLNLLSTTAEWKAVGSSGNWKVDKGIRYKDEYEVTVASRTGATCSPSLTATGTDLVFTYQTDSGDKEVRIQSQSKHTQIKPGNGVTMTLVTAQLLSYRPSGTGFIKQVAVGSGGNPAVLCSFTAANQLDHILILNVP